MYDPLLPLDRYLASDAERALASRIDALAEDFLSRAPLHDADGSFPHEDVDALIAISYQTLTLAREMGGQGASLRLMLNLQERLAAGDPSLALGMGWHLSLLLGLRSTGAWPAETFARLAQDVIHKGALVNSCASERETGSPSRGGRPTTVAQALRDGGYRITGRKTWSTLSPRLTYFLVTATLKDPDGTEDGRIGEFLVPADTPGLEVEETWNSMSLRASGSHDVVLTGVEVGPEALVEAYTPPARSQRGLDGSGPLLHVAACYLGIGLRARIEVVRFALHHRPNSLVEPIAALAPVEESLGRIETALSAAHALVYEAAEDWDAADPAERPGLSARMGAAKVQAVDAAMMACDLAMRIVGGQSLRRDLPFERLYRDVRAGLHNPPMTELALRSLGRRLFQAARAREEGDLTPKTGGGASGTDQAFLRPGVR